MLIQKIAMLLAVAYSNKFFFFNKLVLRRETWYIFLVPIKRIFIWFVYWLLLILLVRLMDEVNEELDAVESHQNEDGAKDDDVDIYGDLEATEKESDANSNVIEKFNKLCDIKNRFLDDDFSVEDAEGEEEDVDLYDLNTFENHIATEEARLNVFLNQQKLN